VLGNEDAEDGPEMEEEEELATEKEGELMLAESLGVERVEAAAGVAGPERLRERARVAGRFLDEDDVGG